LQAGMNGYVSKPVQAGLLIAAIEAQLAASSSRPAPVQLNRMESFLTDRLMQDDKALMSDMLQLFLQLAPDRLERLETAAGSGDAATLAEEAKMITAAAQQIDSNGLGRCACNIQEAAARGDFATVKLEVETLRREIESLEALTT
jgi:HPt (histidine-containing phosphotransfer) domain-containing protein